MCWTRTLLAIISWAARMVRLLMMGTTAMLFLAWALGVALIIWPIGRCAILIALRWAAVGSDALLALAMSRICMLFALWCMICILVALVRILTIRVCLLVCVLAVRLVVGKGSLTCVVVRVVGALGALATAALSWVVGCCAVSVVACWTNP